MSAAPDNSNDRVDRHHVDEALGRVRSGDDAVFITENGDEIAAVVSLDEFRRYLEFREWEDEIDARHARKVLDDPNAEWDSWEDVKRELFSGPSREGND